MPSASPENMAYVLKITLQFLIAVWALTSMSIFQGYQKSRRTIRTHFCAESVFLLFVFKQLYQKSSTRFCLHLIGQDLVMAIISCKTHWKWPCNRTDASTSQGMQKKCWQTPEAKRRKEQFSTPRVTIESTICAHIYFRVLASRIVRHCFKPPCFWYFVMAAIGNWYSKLFNFYLTSSQVKTWGVEMSSSWKLALTSLIKKKKKC